MYCLLLKKPESYVVDPLNPQKVYAHIVYNSKSQYVLIRTTINNRTDIPWSATNVGNMNGIVWKYKTEDCPHFPSDQHEDRPIEGFTWISIDDISIVELRSNFQAKFCLMPK